jgi:endonuclease YncB( thermonuclease family)
MAVDRIVCTCVGDAHAVAVEMVVNGAIPFGRGRLDLEDPRSGQ